MNTLICMAPDGATVTEGRDFPDVSAAWRRADDMGSRWYFYPFCFVTSASGKTIVDAPAPMRNMIGRRVATVAALFASLAADPDMGDADPDEFAFAAGNISF